MTTAVTQRVAENVRLRLFKARIPATQLAKHLGVDQSYMSRRITGRIPFNVDEIEAVAAFLGTTVSELFAEDAA